MEWGSKCVECGKTIPAGRVQRCRKGGFCNHHLPAATRVLMANMLEALKSMLADAEETAGNSYGLRGQRSGSVVDEEWKRADPAQFAIVQHARRAIAKAEGR